MRGDWQIGVVRNTKRTLCWWVSLPLFFLILFILPMGTAVAQQSDSKTPTSTPSQMQPIPTDAFPTTHRTGLAFAKPGGGLEAAISGNSYRLGPGDSLIVNVWGSEPASFRLTVTLEGKIIIPTVGELYVDGLLLDEARSRIREHLLQYFRNVDITVALLQLRRFQVHVLGQVNNPGTYIATAADRVSSAVGWAGGFTESASQRRVSIQVGDSVRAHADLFAFLARGDTKYNPWLQDGDVVYVPFAQERFYVKGAVNQPGAFEYVPGDRLSDALFYAGGFTTDAFLDSIEVARFQGLAGEPFRFFCIRGDGLAPARSNEKRPLPEILTTFVPRIGAAGASTHSRYPDFDLQPTDMIFVRLIPEDRLRRLVEVRGEIHYPGYYAISEDATRLSEVIAWAGGVTPEAFLREAKIIRRGALKLEDKEYERLKDLPPSEMTPNEYEYFKLKSREQQGHMVVDFKRLILENDASEDLILQRGDLISIPTHRNFISVLGMVRSPGNVTYEPEMTPALYVLKSGGYADRADRRNVRVIRGATSEWVPLGEVDSLEPGDTIWIPEKRDRDWWALFKDTLATTTQILTLYLIVDTASKR